MSSLFVAAGDPSGDIATARLIDHLTDLSTPPELFGLGGSHLADRGMELFAEPNELAVIGFWEVARRYRFFRRLFHRCLEEITRRRPAAVLLVDYPGFNLRLAKRIHGLGIPIIYYIAPQVWAWGRRRVDDLRQYVDRLLTILPFETEWFQARDIAVTPVGHYLLEDIEASLIGSDLPGTKRLALLPGSRYQEVQRMLPTMLEAAAIAQGRFGLEPVVAARRNGFDYDAALERFGIGPVDVVYNDARRVIADSDCVICSSGTATLETAIIGRPMVVVYRTSAITYEIARRVIELDSIGLVNLVLGKKLVPELIQGDCSPSNIVSRLEPLVTETQMRRNMVNAFRRIPGRLGGTGASRRAAEVVAEYL